MNTIDEIYSNWSPTEQAALAETHSQLSPAWAAADAAGKSAIELQFTTALNNYRISLS